MYRVYISHFRLWKTTKLKGITSLRWQCDRFLSSKPNKNISDIEKKTTEIPTVYDKYHGIIQCYKFPYIVYISWLARLKLYFLPLVTVSIMAVNFCVQEGECTYEDLYGTFIVGGTAFSSKCLFSIPAYQFIGCIYVNPSNSEVVLSYLDIFGNRIDERFEPGDLYIETRKNRVLQYLDKIYVFLRSRKENRTFRINLSEADVVDIQLFTSVFGDIPDSAC